MATFTSVANLATGLTAEANAHADTIDAALVILAPFVSTGTGATKFDVLCQEIKRLRVLGLDANDPLPGLQE